jgi:glycine cleavage system transcriptional repressor
VTFEKTMKKQLLVTAAGEDRPGIVARLTEVFVKHGANLEESRMAILGGEFAAIIMIAVPDERIEDLRKELKGLEDETITVTTKSTKPLDPKRFVKYAPYQIDLAGADHEGIVHKVSRFLKDHSINIQCMDTEVVPAPVSGTPLFHMKATVLVPPSISFGELQHQLDQLGDEECVDIAISARALEAGC